MFFEVVRFELRKRLGMLSSYVYLALFFACGVFSMLALGGAFTDVSAGAGSEKLLANSPFMIFGLINSLTLLGVLVSAAVFGQAIHQDFETRCDALLFTTQLRKPAYLGGRFVGALLFVLAIFLAIPLGLWLTSLLPFIVERTLFGPTRAAAFFYPFLTTVVPNVLITGSLFFALGTLTRRMMPVYIGAVVLVVGYLAANVIAGDVENKTLAALIDPFGTHAVKMVTRYWTTSEKNTLLIPLAGLYLMNRLLWASAALLVLGFTASRFRLQHVGTAERSRRPAVAQASVAPTALPVATLQYRSALVLARLSWLGFVETVKNTYFTVILLAGGSFTLVAVHLTGKLAGTPTYPVTYRVAEAAGAGFQIFVLILLTFYAGEIVWRERDLQMDQILDALPVRTWVPFVAKVIALCMMLVVLLLAVVLFGVAYQTTQGYHHHELGLYAKLLFGLELPGYIFLGVLAVSVQSVVQNKYVGHAVMVTYFALSQFQDRLGLQHTMFKFGEHPRVIYSDMNGFGHFIGPVVFYDLYGAGLTVLVAVVGGLLWTRGTESSFRRRLLQARARFSIGSAVVVAAGLLLTAGAGGTILYNTTVLNSYRTDHADEALQATYEKKYKSFEGQAQPRITAVKVDFDLFPSSESLDARGRYVLENRAGKPISTIFVHLPAEQSFRKLSVGSVAAPTQGDALLGFYTFTLPQPLEPGATIPLEFDIHFQDRGFKEDGNRTDLAENGLFFHNQHLPHLGYDPDLELPTDNVRKKYDLLPRARLKDLHDPTGPLNNLMSSDADWITFESTVSTDLDQTAIVPGYLERSWVAGGRRYFHYVMDSKILDFYAVQSGRYQVLHDTWNGVSLEIYFHPTHTYDLEEMMRGMKDALAYASANFGPYPHRQARVIEFPRYQEFAQSFPNTIPYSEAIGFIARVDHSRPDDVDMPLLVTAHEVAHQWWGHQVIGAKVQGVSMLDETLAEYTAMMVVKKAYGPKQMRRFLKYEIDRYLQGRASEQQKEVPLMRVENQGYIHYAKGGAVMYALQDYIGEDKVNAALARFLAKTRLQGPPYPISSQLVDELRAVTPEELKYVIHDLFETITLYDNRAETAVARRRADGKYEVTVTVRAGKMQADDQGQEHDVPVDDFIDVGALDESGEAIFLERRRLPGGVSTQTFVVDRLPAKAGIDPLDKLIDRHPDDNVTAVTVQ
jgi:ABC-2 type transport system permease protein